MDDLAKNIGQLASQARLTQTPAAGDGLFSGEAAYDYSHLLAPEHKKAGYRLYVDHSDYGNISAHLFHPKGYAGGVDGKMDGSDLHVDGAQVMGMHRGQGFGTALYEAVVSHAAKKFNAERWVGGDHSTAAHKLHQRLTAKHGFRYEGGVPNAHKAAAPVGDFDGKFGSYAIHLKSEIDAMEEELNKVLPTPTFPKLGMPDNRRETKLIQTPTEQNTLKAVVGNMAPKVQKRAAKSLVTGKEQGGTLMDAKGNGTVVSYAKPTEGANAQATIMHEDVHRMFQRVEQTHGLAARKNLARNMLMALPRATQNVVRQHGIKMAGNSNLQHEEAIGYLVTYLNSPEHRQALHSRERHGQDQAKTYNVVMKRAYKQLLDIAGVADERWLANSIPWSQK